MATHQPVSASSPEPISSAPTQKEPTPAPAEDGGETFQGLAATNSNVRGRERGIEPGGVTVAHQGEVA